MERNMHMEPMEFDLSQWTGGGMTVDPSSLLTYNDPVPIPGGPSHPQTYDTIPGAHPPGPSFAPPYPPSSSGPLPFDRNPLAPYIKTLVLTHGCIRSNARCERQLSEYWLPTLPPGLRACDLECVMAECLRLGRRMYVTRAEKGAADGKWMAYCAERGEGGGGAEKNLGSNFAARGGGKRKCHAQGGVGGAGAGMMQNIAPLPLQPQMQMQPPPPLPLWQSGSAGKRIERPTEAARTFMGEQEMYLVIAAYEDLSTERVRIVGKFLGNGLFEGGYECA